MSKKLIRLTESDLHRIVEESVNRILKEHTLSPEEIGDVFNCDESDIIWVDYDEKTSHKMGQDFYYCKDDGKYYTISNGEWYVCTDDDGYLEPDMPVGYFNKKVVVDE